MSPPPEFWTLRTKRIVSGLLACLLAASFLGAALPRPAAANAVGPTDPAELEAFLDGVLAVQMEENHLPGVVVSVVKDGRPFFAKGYGYAGLEERVPVDPDRTLFRPGSVSKLFVWTAVMQMVEQGKVSLDEDVNTYLDFTIPATYPEPITLRNIMTHTPGFEDIGEDLVKLTPQEMKPLETYLKDSLPARVFPPGQLSAYSNYATALAGYIVERVSGMPFTEYVEQNILGPLGMEHSTFRQPLPESLAPDMARGYNFWQGEYVEGGFEYVAAYPAGSMSATANDMARFMIAHLQNGQLDGARILEEATAVQMHQQLFSPDPRLGGMAYGFFAFTQNDLQILSHGGDTILFHSGLFLVPAENLGLFISTNGAGGARNGQAVFKAFLDHYYPVEHQADWQPPNDFAERIRPYLGQYTMSRSNFTGFEKILSLFTPVSFSLDEDGYVVANLMGEIMQFVEVEPGLLQERYHPGNQVVYQTSESGQEYLLLPQPFALIKTPWYGTTALHAFLFLLSLILFLATLASWAIGALKDWRKREPKPLWPRLARWTAVLFGLLLLVFFLGLFSVVGNIDPAYGVPRIYFSTPPVMSVLAVFPPILAILSLLMLVFAVLAWKNGYWQSTGRFHYTLLALAALSTIWQLAYWNLLL